MQSFKYSLHKEVYFQIRRKEQGKHFYCHVLGLKEVEKPESLKGLGGFWIQVGTTEVHVGTEDDFDRLTTKAHIAYQVDDVSYWKKVLAEHQIDIFDSVPIPNFERFEFRDPFGNRVEIIEPIQ